MCQTEFIINSDTSKIEGIQKNDQIKIKKHKFKIKKCAYCDKKFTPNHPHNLYCSSECRYYSDLDHTLERVRRYRKRYGNLVDVTSKIGTGGLGPHRRESFVEEQKKISNELQKLGLKK